MNTIKQEFEGKQFILKIHESLCNSKNDLLNSDVFSSLVTRYCEFLYANDSYLLKPFLEIYKQEKAWTHVINLLKSLSELSVKQVIDFLPSAAVFRKPAKQRLLFEFVEDLYNYWRSFDRFIILQSSRNPNQLEARPYRAFNSTIETLTHLVRATYRDICENITGNHPKIYRQVSAGCDIGLIAVTKETKLPPIITSMIRDIPFIRQMLINPPLIIDPPMNKRTGQFRKVDSNPLKTMVLDKSKWLCYPAQVGELVIFIYFHHKFIGLGCSLANLFELATDEQILNGPDAIYLFGAPPLALKHYGDLPTVFYDDTHNNLLVAAVPCQDEFGYFGYLKKMVLTLHNILMMKRDRLPFHGAMVRIYLKSDKVVNVLIIGDTATGKSESLEAFRVLGSEFIGNLRIIADDMGSLTITENGEIHAFGTEIGAFIRLDDLQPGFAFDQIDRSIFMSPHKINARVVLPVTTIEDVLKGYPIDFLLYANNYEEVNSDQPIIDKIDSLDTALGIFRNGLSMSKGTTTSQGLVENYFANIFGPPQYKELHEQLAHKYFKAAFDANIWIGQLRTRLGISGYETKGPQEAANALLALISK